MKFGLMFAHQVPPESGIASHETYRDMLRCLPRAEELGYVSAFQCSHHVQQDGFCPGPLVAMAGAAAVTERMRIGTAVLLVPLYAPLKLAEDVAVIDNLSGGRFVFGVAPGYVSEEFAAHGVPREERVGRFEEALDLMVRAWTEERFSFEGRYYRVPEGCMTPKPVQRPHPPIWYGVSAPGSLRRAVARRCVQIMSPRHGLPSWRPITGPTRPPRRRPAGPFRSGRSSARCSSRRPWRRRRRRPRQPWITSTACFTAPPPPPATGCCGATTAA